MPPISQASPLPPARSYDPSSSSPVSFRNPSTSPSSSRNPLRPYNDAAYADELVRMSTSDEGLSSALAPRPPVEASRRSQDGSGLRSLSGKRKVPVAGMATSASTTSALAAGRGAHRRGQSHAAVSGLSRTGLVSPPPPHVHSAPLPASSSLPNLAAVSASTSPTTPKKGAEQVAKMLLGEAGAKVERAWQGERDKERKRTDKRRIEELEQEVKRLRGEVRRVFRSRPRLLRTYASHTAFGAQARTFTFLQDPAHLCATTASSATASPSSARQSPSSPVDNSARFSTRDSGAAQASPLDCRWRRGCRHVCLLERARR